MQRRFLRPVLTIVFFCIFNFSCTSPSAGLLSTLGGYTQLSGMATLLKSAGGLKNIIGNGKGPFTLLAPTNNAISTLGTANLENLLKPENKEQLIGILKKHVLAGKFKADQIKAGGLKDASGNELNIGNAIISESIPTKGGMIQVIDKVLY
jgi:uncharacterized surface protein with fasciclin (FAS1) repeats